MATELISHEIAGARFIIESTDNYKVLTSGASSVTSATLHDGDTDYQVPSDKTFYMTGFKIISGTSARNMTIAQSDAADAATNHVIKVATVDRPTEGMWEIATPDLPSFASNKYVNWYVNSTSSAGDIIVYGFEA